MYPGSAPLAEIFLAEVSGSHIKSPGMLAAEDSRRSSEKCEPEIPTAEGGIRSLSVPAKNNEPGPAEGDLETGNFNPGTVKVLVTGKARPFRCFYEANQYKSIRFRGNAGQFAQARTELSSCWSSLA